MRIPSVRLDPTVRQGLVLGLAVFAVGLATRTRDVGGDDTVFAAAVEGALRGRGEPGILFAVHHALYNPLVAAVAWAVRLVRPEALVLDVGAAVSSFFCGVAAGGLATLLLRRGLDTAQAILAAACVAASGGMWSIATRMEVYTLAAAAVVGWLAACTARPPRPLVVGAALASAVLAHAALAVLVAPTVWSLRRDPRACLRAVLVGFGVPAVFTLAVLTLARGVWTPSGWIDLVFPRDSLHYVAPDGAWLAPHALAALVLWNWYRAVPVLLPGAARALDVAGTMALVVAAGLVGAGLWRAVRGSDGTGRTSAVALAAFVPLWLLWDTGNPEHVVAAAPLFGVLIALGASALARRAGRLVLATLLALLVAANGIGGAALQRRPENGRLWVTASFVEGHVAPQAVILAVGSDPRLRLGLGYLSGRSVVDLTLAVNSARETGRPATDALAYWLERARRAPELWSLDEVLDPASESAVSDLGIPRESWRAALAGFAPDDEIVLEADGAVVREPFRIRRLHPRPERGSQP